MKKILFKLLSGKNKIEEMITSNQHHHVEHHKHHKHHGKKWELIDDLIDQYNSKDWSY